MVDMIGVFLCGGSLENTGNVVGCCFGDLLPFCVFFAILALYDLYAAAAELQNE